MTPSPPPLCPSVAGAPGGASQGARVDTGRAEVPKAPGPLAWEVQWAT